MQKLEDGLMTSVAFYFSDYSREEIDNNPELAMYKTIFTMLEKEGYKIHFKTNILRRIFGFYKYKVIVTK